MSARAIKTQVINLFGGPGAGKSTTAAGIFYKLKQKGISCELIDEYAKQLTWEGRFNELGHQLYILAKQTKKLERLVGKVDYIITDSPIIQCYAYVPDGYYKSFMPLVDDIWGSFSNWNYLLTPNHDYEVEGRNQTEEQAKMIHDSTKGYLELAEIPFVTVDTSDAVTHITRDVCEASNL